MSWGIQSGDKMVIAELVTQLILWIKELGWIGVFIGVLLESFIAPVPSPLVPMGAGFILIPPEASIYEASIICFYTIVLAGALGSTIGAFFGYGIGYFGGRPLIKRFERFIGVSWNEIEKTKKLFEKGYKDDVILFISRAIPIIPLSPVSFFAGVGRLDVKKFTLWTFVGSIPRYFVLGLVGWFMGVAYGKLSQSIEFFESVIFLSIIILIVIFILYRVRRRWKSK